MLGILLTGVGGQGTVLAAKILAQAAWAKGWHVRTAETIGMAQRGGSVVSHVRMGDRGEEVYAPLLGRSSADLIVAFEPAEAARVLPYLAADGMLVTAQTSVQPVTAALSKRPYDGREVLSRLSEAFSKAPERLMIVDDRSLLQMVSLSVWKDASTIFNCREVISMPVLLSFRRATALQSAARRALY